jgi:YHS domain-containing protein
MNRPFLRAAALLAGFAGSALGPLPAEAEEAEATPAAALRGLDPVELAAGREVPGAADRAEVHGGFRYRFASEENRKRFVADPVRHGIRFDGACMRMGPVAGPGHPDRFAVHEGRIYLFASDACRNRFLADPARWIDGPDAPPAADEAARRRGGEILDLAVKGMGGAEALAKATTLRVRIRTSGKRGDTAFSIETTRTVRVPGVLRVATSWDGSPPSAWLLVPGAGRNPAAARTPVGEEVRGYMEREYHRQPYALLQAWRRGEATAAAAGAGKAGEVPVERVAVHAGGATTTLAVDPATGRILEAAWRGRTAVGITDTLRRYADFRETGGLLLPHAVAVEVEGKPVEDRTEMLAVEVDPEGADADLAPPPAPGPISR